MNYAQHTLSFILNTTWDQIPTEVRHQSKRCLLDTLGAMTGVISTILAQKGFTGIRPLFEDSPENDRISGLGSRYEIMCLVKRKWIGLFLISGGLAPLKTFEIC